MSVEETVQLLPENIKYTQHQCIGRTLTFFKETSHYIPENITNKNIEHITLKPQMPAKSLYTVSHKQVQKVLWTRKAPACLLTPVYAYGKPCQTPVHKYSSLRSSAHRGAAGHCVGRCATGTAPVVY